MLNLLCIYTSLIHGCRASSSDQFLVRSGVEAHLSIGKSWCATGKNSRWEAVRRAKKQFGQVLEPIRNFLVSQHEQLSKGISVRKALLLDIYMIGPTAEQARPTIIFTCENKTQRQRAQELVRNSKLLDQYPGFGLGESARPLRLTISPQPLVSDGDATVKGE